MANCAIVGINWGDEGKGRMVDYLTQRFDVVVRYQGGGNAGHTVVNELGKFALHLLPSGIFRSGVVNILGNGVAVDLENLKSEMDTVRAAGVAITPENLKISDRASLLLPWHRELDALEEQRLKDKKYGSTKQGIAPFYGDKYQKKTVMAGELLHPEHLREHLADLLEWKNLILTKVYGAKGYTMDELMEWVETYGAAMKPYITDTTRVLREAQAAGKSILFEAQLGALRDLDYGIYPYTTSSNSIAAYAPVGSGLPTAKIDEVVGVVKAYSSCVGEGPFVCEWFGEEAEQLHKRIAELEAILGSERKLLGVIKKELGEIGAQYGDERRTTILREEELPPVEEEDDLETPVPEDAVVLYTRGGQLRRMAPRIFDKLDLTTQESDMPRYLLRTQTDHTLLFFTDRGQCYTLAVSAINESLRPKERGVALTGILQGIEADEKCVRILDIAPKAFESTPDLLFFTQNGLVKRSAATEYAVRRQRFAALALKDGDRVVDVALAQPHADVAIIARSGMSIRFALDTVPAQGRASGGVKGIALAIGDQVIRGCTLQNSEQMLVFSESGYAKRIPGAMLDPQGRGGKGVKCFGFNKNGSNGSYIAACVKLSGVRDFTVLQAGGMLSPMNSESIACQSLADKGKTAVIALMDDVVTDIILW